MAKIFIGVAWPYANGPIHLGHVAGCYLPADIFARFCRARGDDVLMVSGSDQHGTPITVTADAEGTSPEEVAERFHKINAKCMVDLGVTFDMFLKTHLPEHFKVVHDMFLTLQKKGHIYKKIMNASYCGKCVKFLPDRYVEGKCPHCKEEGARGDQCDSCGKTLDPEELEDARCKLCGQTPETRETEHFFLKLTNFESLLKEFVADKSHWRHNTKHFTENWLEMGLKDRPITRDIKWGIPIPVDGWDDKRIYVWFEAVIGYLSMAKLWAKQRGTPDAWKDFWQNDECRHYYFLAKDNIPFHTIIWPAMLMGYEGLNLPYDVPANEYLRLGGTQFSKSRGISIDAPDVLEKYNPDQLRYYLSTNMPENRDADFTWEDFYRRCNEELTAAFGNFVHRCLTFTHKNYGEIPPAGELADLDEKLVETISQKHSIITEHLDKCHFKDALKELMDLAREGNRYFDAKAPWAQLKEDRAACGTTLHMSARLVKALAHMSYPYLPHSAQKMWSLLGFEGDISDMPWDAALEDIPEGQKLERPKPLFSLLDIEELKKDEAPEEPDASIQKLDLRVGRVAELNDHPDADKLYVLKVDLGTETRQIVAGLKPHYPTDELLGKKIVVVCNLEPAKLRGVESQGMLLAAGDGSGVVSLLVPPENAEPGTRVTGEGVELLSLDPKAKKMPFKEFLEFSIKVAEGEPQTIAVEKGGMGGKDTYLVTEKGVAISLDRPVPAGSKVK